MDMSEPGNYPNQKLSEIIRMLKLDIKMSTMSLGKPRLILIGRRRDKNNVLVQSFCTSNYVKKGNELKAFHSVTNWVRNRQRW